MPEPQAAPVHVSSLQLDILQHIVRRTTSAQRLVKRAHIILEAGKGTSTTKISSTSTWIMKRYDDGVIAGERLSPVCRPSKRQESQNC